MSVVSVYVGLEVSQTWDGIGLLGDHVHITADLQPFELPGELR